MSGRLLLEVLKFLNPASLLQGVALSCKSWHLASEVEEVWQSLSENFNFGPRERATWKLHFKLHFFDDQTKLLAILHRQKLTIFSCESETFVHSMNLALIESSSSLALVSQTEVIACGGSRDDSGRIALLCEVKNGSVTRMPDMMVSRCFHTVFAFRRTVYVFGGHGAMTEKLDLKEKKWKRLPNMLHCRMVFHACRRGMSVYLCGGGTKHCERFLIERDCFISLPFSLRTSGYSATFLYSSEIIVLSNKWLYYITGNDVRQTRKPKSPLSEEMYHVSSTSPAVFGSKVYFSQGCTDIIITFDMETYINELYSRPIEC